MLHALQDFSQSARGMQGSARGRLRIGTILDPEFTRLGAFLKELVEAAPQIDTELSQHMSGDVLARVQQGALDVAFADFVHNKKFAPWLIKKTDFTYFEDGINVEKLRKISSSLS